MTDFIHKNVCSVWAVMKDGRRFGQAVFATASENVSLNREIMTKLLCIEESGFMINQWPDGASSQYAGFERWQLPKDEIGSLTFVLSRYTDEDIEVYSNLTPEGRCQDALSFAAMGLPPSNSVERKVIKFPYTQI